MLGHEVVSVRQHYLHYDIRVTPYVHEKAGFKYDSTLGFNDNIGFRFGTCYPWRLYDLIRNEELAIKEVPLIIQDGALMHPQKGMRLDKNTSFDYIKRLSNAVKNVGGVLTIVWHTNIILNQDLWDLYKKTLNYLKNENACFCKISDL